VTDGRAAAQESGEAICRLSCPRQYYKPARMAGAVKRSRLPLDGLRPLGRTPGMLDAVRDALYRAITTPRGDSLLPLRLPKDLARRLNMTLGLPLAPRDELERRARARASLAELRAAAPAAPRGSTEAAPVLVYFEKDRNVRELVRIEELLAARGIAWKRLDLAGDEATVDFVMRKANCERDDLPVVFIADHTIGNYQALVRADVEGRLARLVQGAPS
jgi:hypothetical protein